MKLLIAAAALSVAAGPLAAQDAHAGHAGHAVATPAPAAPAKSAARLNLETPVQTIMADAAGKAVIDKHIPGMDKHPQYEMAKAMSLSQLAGFAPQHFPPELMAKIEADLALVK